MKNLTNTQYPSIERKRNLIFTLSKQQNNLNSNGIEDHIHILSDLHSGISLADFVKSIKVATSLWLKQSPDFPDFKGWGEGYAAFTYAYKDKENLINYIKNQQKHHRKENNPQSLRFIGG